MLRKAFAPVSSHYVLRTNTKPIFRCNSTKPQFEEVRIPMPWGHLAGKWWGPKDKRPILTFHGWQDNCGSFDRLLPLLPKHLSFLALDFPGHGHSSNLPPGQFYYNTNYIILIRRLQNYFQWEKLSIMGHSLGAIISFGFAGLFPNSIEFCICIDGLQVIVNADKLDGVTRGIDNFLKFDAQEGNNTQRPCYTMEVMIDMLEKSYAGSIDRDKYQYILARNVKPSETEPGLFYFDRDPRLKSGQLFNWSLEDILDHARRVNFPLFSSRTEKYPVVGYEDNYQQVKEILMEKPNTECHLVAGTHHGHLNTPEFFVEIISKFIEMYDVGDKAIDQSLFESIKYR